MLKLVRFLLLVGFISAMSSEVCISQTKEQLYDMLRIERGAHRSTLDMNLYWLKLGRDQINKLRYSGQPEAAQELRQTLAPWLELDEAYAHAAAFGTAEQEEALLEEVLEFRKELSRETGGAMADQVLDILGVDYCVELIATEIASELKVATLSKAQLTFSLASELQNERFGIALVLTAEQKKEIEKSVFELSKRYKEEILSILAEITEVSDDRWERILELLDPDGQRSAVKRFVGIPVEWFRELDQGQLLSELSGHTGGFRASETAVNFAYQRGVKPDDLRSFFSSMSSSELKDAELIVINTLQYEMLRNNSIQKQLEFTDEQQAEIGKQYSNENAIAQSTPDRFLDLMKGDVSPSGFYEKVLLPKQVERLRQIEWQIRAGEKFVSTVGVLEPRTIRFLELSDKQIAAIKKVGREYMENFEDLRDKVLAVQKRFRTEMDRSLGEILDERQNNLFSKFTGRRLKAKS